MPGLINKNKRSALPLSVSEITSCVRGYTLVTTASMTYNNTEDNHIEVQLRLWDKMPGLINKNKRSALPLSVSEITSCVRGYTLVTTASMTYNNTEDNHIEGLFVYPLDEFSTVVGFEAMISRRILTVQIKDKTKMDDCYFDCCTMSNGTFQSGSEETCTDGSSDETAIVTVLVSGLMASS
ncbi:UNVERIFIED_CONTAM: hypothetical protein FKN15_005493 [Acipenser sinensis]